MPWAHLVCEQGLANCNKEVLEATPSSGGVGGLPRNGVFAGTFIKMQSVGVG